MVSDGMVGEDVVWEGRRVPAALFPELQLPRRHDRPARTAELAVRFRAVELQPPARHAARPPVRV